MVDGTGSTAVGPVPRVVRGAKSGWSITAGETAPAIPGGKGAANTKGDGAHGATNIEGLGVTAQHHGNQLAIAGQTTGIASADSCP